MASQFHVYLPLSVQLSVLNVKALVGAGRGLLRDCEIFANLRIAFVSSSRDQGPGLRHFVTLVIAVPKEDDEDDEGEDDH